MTSSLMKSSTRVSERRLEPDEARRVREAEFAWDLVLQLAARREERGLSQAEVAKLLETKQQAISRLEDPTYTGHGLRILRDLAKVLNAYVDVVIVPEEKLAEYEALRYHPVLDQPRVVKDVAALGSVSAAPLHASFPPVGWQTVMSRWADIAGVARKSRPMASHGEIAVHTAVRMQKEQAA